MTVKPAPPCECRASAGSTTRFVDVLARSTGANVLTVEHLSCEDVHDMIRSLIDARDLTHMDRTLVAEIPAAPTRYTRGSQVLAYACIAAVLGLCLFFGWLLRPLAGFLL